MGRALDMLDRILLHLEKLQIGSLKLLCPVFSINSILHIHSSLALSSIATIHGKEREMRFRLPRRAAFSKT